MLFLILLSSVVCQAEPWKEYFIVDFEQKSVFPNQNFSIKLSQHILPGNSSDIAATSGQTRLDSTPDETRDYRAKTTIIDSISWLSLSATHLPSSYELTLTTKDASASTNPYSWLPAEVFIAVGWLLKNYWSYSPSFNPIEQQEVSQDHPFASITVVPGPTNNQPSYQSSESSWQQTPKTTSQPSGSFTSLHQCAGTGDGKRGPQQPLHSLGLHCFVLPCRGICAFRPLSDSRGPTEWLLNSAESSASNPTLSMSAEAVFTNGPTELLKDNVTKQGNVPFTADDWLIVNGLLNLSGQSLIKEIGISPTPTHLTRPVETSPSGYLPSGRAAYYQHTLTSHKKKDRIRQKICDVTVDGKDGQQRPCEKVYKSVRALEDHKRR
uniref:hypothetical protein n=1 Tax=Endozoicomonas sp. ONNA1 TaxID=2828740 RepID=UPI002149586F